MELGDAEFREVAPGVLAALVDAGVGEVEAEVGDLAGLVRRVEKPFDVALNSEEVVLAQVNLLVLHLDGLRDRVD